MVTITHKPEITRQKLLDSAAEEMRRSGFRSSSLDRILSQTGVTKGALYHHFRNKLELGYAVVDEVYRVRLVEQWVGLLAAEENPIDAIISALKKMCTHVDGQDLQCGCPINNLAQEMSPLDEGFRTRIQQTFEAWRGLISAALKRGQEAGAVRANLDCDKAAIFVTSVIEGGVGAAKNAHDVEILRSCLEGLEHYLEALRPRASFRAGT